MLAEHLSGEQLLQEHPGDLYGALGWREGLGESRRRREGLEVTRRRRMFTWLTVVPMLPWSSICRIFGSLDLMAESSLATWRGSVTSPTLGPAHLHLDVLYGHLYGGQDDLLLVGDLGWWSVMVWCARCSARCGSIEWCCCGVLGAGAPVSWS